MPHRPPRVALTHAVALRVMQDMRPGHLSLLLSIGVAIGTGIALAQDIDVTERVSSSFGNSISGVTAGEAIARQRQPNAFEAELGARIGRWVESRRNRPGPTPPQPTAAPTQRSISVPPDAQIHWRDNGLPRRVSSPSLETIPSRAAQPAAGLHPSRVVLNFIHEYRDLFQVADAHADLELIREEADALGFTHLRFQQRHQGLRVIGCELLAHIDINGHLTCVESTLEPQPALASIEPVVTAVQAATLTKVRFPGGQAATHSPPELAILAPSGEAARLAWTFELVVGYSQAWRVVVDATSGELLSRESRICTANVAGRGIDLLGTSRNLNVWQSGVTYYLIDASKPSFDARFNPLVDGRGVILIADAQAKPLAQLTDSDIIYVTSSSPNAWTVRDGVSASYCFSQTYDYFRDRHGRNSYDNQGTTLTALVRIGGLNNAFWNGAVGMMGFGDAKPYAASLDVIGHEVTHGVVEKSAGLVYENQPGALNEAFADIFGEMTEARTDGQPDWLLGTRLGSPIRNMKNPAALNLPSKMSEFRNLPNTDAGDHGGVHYNSSIINRAFYQLAAGLPNAVGLVAAERIFYRALTVHLLAQSKFIDARLATITSAEELFGVGSAQAVRTAEAFDSVEIFAAPSTTPPPSIPVVAAPDSYLTVEDAFFGGYELRRWEGALNDGSFGRQIATGIKRSRPAVDGAGRLALFVTSNHDLASIDTADPTARENLGEVGRIHSVAISPDSHYVSLVLRNPATGIPENEILLLDLLKTTNSRTIQLAVPLLDGSPVDNVLYADAMTFSADSTLLIYDALSTVRFGGGTPVRRWSISAVDPATGRTSVVIPPLNGVDTGNPSFGRAGNRYLLFEATDVAARLSYVFVADLFAGEAGNIRIVDDVYTYPCFTGDDRAVIYSAPDGNIFGSGVSLYKINLTADRLDTSGNPVLWIGDAYMGIVYRRGTFVGTNAGPEITLSPKPAPVPPSVPVQLGAKASDPDGSIARVEFYDGSRLLGQTLTPTAGSYLFNWTPTTLGTHRLIARAIDNLGASADSTPVLVQVQANRPALTLSRLPSAQVRIAVTGGDGSYDLQRSSDLKTWTKVTSLTANPAATLDQPANTAGIYYRLLRP